MRASSSTEFKVSPLTLRFEGDLEAAFLDDYFLKSLSQVRFGVGMGVFFCAIFGFLDYLLIPRVIEQVWFLRYVILCPSLLLIYVITWSSYARILVQPVLVAAVLLSGFGIIAMTVIAYPPGSYYYYAGLLLVLMWCYTFTTACFLYATFAGWTLVLVYVIVAIFLSNTPPTVLISNSFFFVSASIIGMLSCHQIELYKRRDPGSTACR
jgi:hypothetical protein